jgi:hypothetical protein
MAVAVYSQLDRLLRERSLTVTDLKRQIEERFDSVVETTELDRLAGSEALDQADLSLIGAIADTLGITLSDLFDVQADSVRVPSQPPMSFLTERQEERLSELLQLRDERKLSADERRELHVLVYDENGRRLIDYYRRKQAQQQGISLEQVKREEDEAIARAKRYLRSRANAPRLRQEIVERQRQQAASPT